MVYPNEHLFYVLQIYKKKSEKNETQYIFIKPDNNLWIDNHL